MYKTNTVLLAVALASLPACNKNKDNEALNNLKTEALDTYARTVEASYADCVDYVQTLDNAINAFVANPSEAGFEACKQAWLDARIPYGQTEVYRFYGGPIDGLNNLVNAWPIDESFLDYVDGNPAAGIIQNPEGYPVITAQLLENLNGSFSERSVFTGFHVIEFLLWGQDRNPAGTGARPYTDYVAGGTAAYPERRAACLAAASARMLEHLQQLHEQWGVNGAYRRDFLQNTDPDVAVGRIFTALEQLSQVQLADASMSAVVAAGNGEAAQSCFSDNSITDIKMNFLGMKNVWFGKYTSPGGKTITGTGFLSVVELADPDKAAAVTAGIMDGKNAIDDIPLPYDQTVVLNAAGITPAVTALEVLSRRFAEVWR